MGTNYYHHTKECPTCGHYEEMHIGKSSGGWTFSFQGTEEIRSWSDWQRRLKAGGTIWDEYGREVTFDELQSLILNKRAEPKRHYDVMLKEYPSSMEGQWIDQEGHDFSSRDFS